MADSTKESQSNNFFIVAIGASAGGLKALESFFSHLPDHPNAAFVVVQHLSPDYKSMMTEILQRKTPMAVNLIEDGWRSNPVKFMFYPLVSIWWSKITVFAC